MIRRITSLALGIAVSMAAFSAFAQDEGGEKPAGEEAKPAEEGAKPAEGAGQAKAEGEASASASGVPDQGGKVKVGLRVGYMLPMGDAMKNGKMSDAYSGGVPIWLDLGYMVTPNLMVGVYADYAFLMLASKAKDACDALKVDCSATQLRFGLQGQYHLSPAESLDPWVGLGVGYEMVNSKSGDAKGGVAGLEFANIQGGADFKVGGPATVGPFLSFSLGQYSKMTGDNSGDIKDKAMHEWLTLGVKGTFGF